MPSAGVPAATQTGFGFAELFQAFAASLDVSPDEMTRNGAGSVIAGSFLPLPAPRESGDAAASDASGSPETLSVLTNATSSGTSMPAEGPRVFTIGAAELALLAGSPALDFAGSDASAAATNGDPSTNPSADASMLPAQAAPDAPSSSETAQTRAEIDILTPEIRSLFQAFQNSVESGSSPSGVDSPTLRPAPPLATLEQVNAGRGETVPIVRFEGESTSAPPAPLAAGSATTDLPDPSAGFRRNDLPLRLESVQQGPAVPLGLAETTHTATPGAGQTRGVPLPPGAEQAVVDQTVGAARVLVSRDGGSVRLVLNPPELGVIRVHVEVSGDRARGWIEAESARTRDLVETTLPRLRRAFENHQIHLESVSVRGESGRQANGHPQFGESPDGTGDGRNGARESAPGEPSNAAVTEGIPEIQPELEEANGRASRTGLRAGGWDLIA